MFQDTKDDIRNMTRTIHEYKENIKILKEDLTSANRVRVENNPP